MEWKAEGRAKNLSRDRVRSPLMNAERVSLVGTTAKRALAVCMAVRLL